MDGQRTSTGMDRGKKFIGGLMPGWERSTATTSPSDLNQQSRFGDVACLEKRGQQQAVRSHEFP